MGRIKASDLGQTLNRRLDTKAETAAEPPPAAQPVAATAEAKARKREREGTRYVGCHISEDLAERLRVIAFETRREKQSLMAEGIEYVVKRYGQ